MAQDDASGGHDPIEELNRREEALVEAAIEAALIDARLRGREASLEASRQTLEARAAWIDGVAGTLQRLGADVPGSDEHLRGLGAGAAREEADLGAYVRRSSTLMLARAAMVATREELLARRRAQQQSRAQEIEALEAALARVEVRLAARERLLLQAVRTQEAMAARRGEPPLTALPPRPNLAAPPLAPSATTAAHRHAATESISADEARALDVAATRRRASGERIGPPVLDLGLDLGAPPPAKARSRRGGASLQLGGVTLRRDRIEVDARSKTLLASLETAPALGATVELIGTGSEGPLALPALVRRVLPSADGGGVAVVLAPSGWDKTDWARLEALLQEL